MSGQSKYKPQYKALKLKKTKRLPRELSGVKAQEYNIPDQDHTDFFLAKNILS